MLVALLRLVPLFLSVRPFLFFYFFLAIGLCALCGHRPSRPCFDRTGNVGDHRPSTGHANGATTLQVHMFTGDRSAAPPRWIETLPQSALEITTFSHINRNLSTLVVMTKPASMSSGSSTITGSIASSKSSS